MAKGQNASAQSGTVWHAPARFQDIAPMFDRLGLGNPEDGPSGILAKNATAHYCIVTMKCGNADQTISLAMLEMLALGFYTGYLGRLVDEIV